MAKNNLNANFENLKAEMMKKKEVAKDIKSDKKTSKSENNNANLSVDKVINNNKNKNVNILGNNNVTNKTNIFENNNTDYNNDNTVNHIENIEVNNITNKSQNTDNSSDTGTNISQNKIVIKKAQKVQPPKRITYYLNQDTIKKIEKYSKLTGMGKSEFVQTLLDISLNNLEIE